MNWKPYPGPRVSSRLPIEGEGGVNQCCHGLTSGVNKNNGHVLRSPSIVLILWGNYYKTNADVVSSAATLVTDLATGPFTNGLAQYGVSSGSLAKTVVIDSDQANPAPASIDENKMRDQLKTWIQGSTPTVSPAPAVNEENLLYFIFPPTSTSLTRSDGTTGFCGYHQHFQFNSNSSNGDTFWGIVDTTNASQSTAQEFVNSVAYCVSHELAEAFTDRDSDGYASTPCKNSDGSSSTCEIGDICESLDTFKYRGWDVQHYWSNWDNTCIQGDAPVSLRRFLTAINFDSDSQPLSALRTPIINLDYIASRMR